jgi:rod shape-determining protein MreD
MPNSVYAAVPLMALLAVGQTAVFARLPILGAVPLIPFLVALLWGLLRGIEEGAIWAFCAGFFLDLFSLSPMGLLPLSMMLAATGAIWIQEAFPMNRVLLPPLLIVLATLLQYLSYLLLLTLFGYGTALAALGNITNVLILHLLFAPPIYGLFYWINQRTQPHAVQV